MKKLFFFLSLALISFICRAQQIEEFKARYILNFANQTEWPAAYRSGNFVIGVIGNSTVAKELQKICKTQKVGGQTVEVKVFSNANSVDKCHLLFIPQNQSGNIGKIVDKTSSNSTLLVSDNKGLVKEGSMINFVLRNKKLNFEMNKNNITKRGLKITSYLEKLAIVIN